MFFELRSILCGGYDKKVSLKAKNPWRDVYFEVYKLMHCLLTLITL